MNRTRIAAGLAVVAALCLIVGNALNAKQAAQQPPQGQTQTPPQGQTQAQGQEAAKPQYTMAEYNAYQACAAERNPTQQIKCLDDFIAKYPNSQLLIYIYPLYYNAYSQLKNFPKVIEYADKLLALGDKVEAPVRYQAYYARAFAYTNLNSQDKDQATKARDAALAGLKTLEALKKPDNMSEEDFNKQKVQPTTVFNYTIASCSMVQKDYQLSLIHI